MCKFWCLHVCVASNTADSQLARPNSIENLTLESQNLLPNIIEFEMRNYFKMSPYSEINDVSKHSFYISFAQVQADLKDVAFYLKKKTGFPKLTDSGYLDVMLGGKGLSGKIHLESTGKKHHGECRWAR